MYEINRVPKERLISIKDEGIIINVFQSYPWACFLERNQKIDFILLEIKLDAKLLCYFVGGIINKMGIRILGSPFEGWLTCEMGFIRINDFNLNEILHELKQYAFNKLHCQLLQITDYKINFDEVKLIPGAIISSSKFLKLNINLIEDDIMNNFTKNGRRDVRTSLKKGANFVKVNFDYDFADIYYKQLEEVFAKQSLKPFYSKKKIYDLVDAFSDYPDMVACFNAYDDHNNNIASVLSFAIDNTAYYLGAASYINTLNLMPNEGLFWKFITYWRSKGIKQIDMVGFRKYKLKYNPEVIDVPIIIFEKRKGIYALKKIAKKMVKTLRTVSKFFYKKKNH